MDNKNLKNYLIYAVLVAIWSTTWAAIKIGLDGTPPLVGLAVRFTIAGLALLLFIAVTGRKIVFNKMTIKLYLLVGVFNMALSYFFTYWGTQFIPSSLTSIIWSSMPLVTGIMAHFILHNEKTSFSRMLAIFISMAGMVLILTDGTLVYNREMLIGCLVVLMAVIVSVTPTVMTKKYKDEFDSVSLTCMAMLIAGVIHTINAWIFGQWPLAVWGAKNIISATYLGVFGSAITFTGMFYLIKHIQVVKISFITFITPIFAIFIGGFFLHEHITAKEIIGMVVIFTGIIFYDFDKYRAWLKRK